MKKVKLLIAISMTIVTVSLRAQETVGSLTSEQIQDILNRIPDTICVFDPSQYFAATSYEMSVFDIPVKEASRNLDFDNVKRLSVGEVEWLQIPIPTEGVPQEAVVRFPKIELNDSPMSPSGAVSTYLIVQNRKKGASSRMSINVVMIVPQPKYMTQEQLDSLDFFYSGHFNGVMFYSNVYGKILKVETFINGEGYQRGRIPDGINPQDEVLVTVRFYRNSFLEGDKEMSGMAYVVEDRREKTE